MAWLISILMVLAFEGEENVTLDDLRWKNRIVLYFPHKIKILNLISSHWKRN